MDELADRPVRGPRFAAALAAIDAANADDPATIVVDGVARPKEQAHAELMTRWVERLDPEADDAQLLAARAHHVRRWTLPRASEPDGRAGYLRWRAALKRMHAATLVSIMEAAGYDAATIERARRIVAKEGLSADPPDPAVQVHEDALCLVFLTTQYDELIDRLGVDKAVDVVRRTVAKMSAPAQGIAAGLPLSATGAEVLGRALQAG